MRSTALSKRAKVMKNKGRGYEDKVIVAEGNMKWRERGSAKWEAKTIPSAHIQTVQRAKETKASRRQTMQVCEGEKSMVASEGKRVKQRRGLRVDRPDYVGA